MMSEPFNDIRAEEHYAGLLHDFLNAHDVPTKGAGNFDTLLDALGKYIQQLKEEGEVLPE